MSSVIKRPLLESLAAKSSIESADPLVCEPHEDMGWPQLSHFPLRADVYNTLWCLH